LTFRFKGWRLGDPTVSFGSRAAPSVTVGHSIATSRGVSLTVLADLVPEPGPVDGSGLMRNRYMDLLRFLAIIRVVVYHTTNWAFLTVVFPAMSLMFALGGALMAASIDRSGRSAIGRRLRRLLPSFWLLAAIFVPAMLLTGLPANWRLLLWVAPLVDPPANYWGALVLSPIWYLRDFLWFVLVSPLFLPLYRRYPLPTLLAPYVALLVIEFVDLAPGAVPRDFALYFGAWLLGFAHHDGLLRKLSRRLLGALTGTLATLGGIWILTHPGPRGFDLNDIPLGNALWSAAFILLVLGLLPQGTAWLSRNRVLDRAVTVLNQRALTVYLWHMPAVILVGVLVDWLAWSHTSAASLTIRMTVVTGLTVLAVMMFGSAEDLAARRRPVLLPGVPAPRVAAGPAGVAPAGGAHDGRREWPGARIPPPALPRRRGGPACPEAR